MSDEKYKTHIKSILNQYSDEILIQYKKIVKKLHKEGNLSKENVSIKLKEMYALNLNGKDIKDLPFELLIDILSKLEFKDIVKFISTNKYINNVFKNQSSKDLLAKDYFKNRKLICPETCNWNFLKEYAHYDHNYNKVSKRFKNFLTINGFQIYAKEFQINVNTGIVPPNDEPNILTPELIQAFETYPQKYLMKRGDVLHNEFEGDYRNDGRYIFDGNKLIQLGFDYDEYGHPPKEIVAFRDVDSRFYSLAHNEYIYCDFSNITFNDIKSIFKKSWYSEYYNHFFNYNIYITHFRYNDENFALIYNKDTFDKNKIEIYDLNYENFENTLDNSGLYDTDEGKNAINNVNNYLKKYNISDYNILRQIVKLDSTKKNEESEEESEDDH